MNKQQPATVAGARIKSFIERVEKLIEERQAIQGDIRDVFSEAKGVGYNPKIMRKVIALRAMDAADRAEQESLLDAYMAALESVDRVQARVAGGESIRTVAASEGVPRSTVHRLSQKGANVENGTPHDHETGEITVSRVADGVESCERSDGKAMPSEQPEPDASLVGEADAPTPIDQSCGGTLSDRASETLEATVSEGSEHRHVSDDAGTAGLASLGPPLTDVASRCEPGPQEPIDLTIPEFLRRVPA